ncbi:hypothetical protein WJX75_009237 [Coccomyxa subellipsoidea]|uniref:Peptidyl-prolyl cis-trans isomerase n=1 Tax=Coccomyxa subellipsoidea TaxID=248742 RepID=A0ABR2Z5S5_9CHLO
MLAAGAAALLPVRNGKADELTSIMDAVDTTITDVVYMNVGVCPDGVRADRTLGDKVICSSTQPLGRIVIGLYGRLLPQTVSNFLMLAKGGAYNGTTFSKVVPGGYVQAGRQGSPRMGLVQPPTDLPANKELLASRSFRLEHSRPGTVSLSIAENDDDPLIKQRPSYSPTEFLITTGPGPVPSLDGQNVVFGTVLEGYDTITAIASQPTFKPNERIQAVNQLASFIGDDRAARRVSAVQGARLAGGRGGEPRSAGGCRGEPSSDDRDDLPVMAEDCSRWEIFARLSGEACAVP